MIRRFVCMMCGHEIKTNGVNYREVCPKCRNFMIESIEPSPNRDVFVVHSEVSPNSHNDAGPQPRYRAIGERD